MIALGLSFGFLVSRFDSRAMGGSFDVAGDNVSRVRRTAAALIFQESALTRDTLKIYFGVVENRNIPAELRAIPIYKSS
ncbi:MAG: hypothetical protein H7Z40_07855 [Phycisphaerae bacterium]|nr:hypothetical protein [Gemmatimonadaceae bacterium]